MLKKVTSHIIYIMFLCLLNATVFGQDVPLTVVGHVKGPPPQLKFNQLQSILKGEKQRWPDGTKVAIALMKTNTSIGTVTSKKLFNMSGDQLNKYWLALVFQGKADAPNFFNSVDELQSFVAQTPGAIGVVSSLANNNKIILVDGQRML